MPCGCLVVLLSLFNDGFLFAFVEYQLKMINSFLIFEFWFWDGDNLIKRLALIHCRPAKPAVPVSISRNEEVPFSIDDLPATPLGVSDKSDYLNW